MEALLRNMFASSSNLHSLKEEQGVEKEELNKHLEEQIKMFMEFREEQRNFPSEISEVEKQIK